jgi:MFS family permease
MIFIKYLKHFLFINPWAIVVGAGIVLFATAGSRFSFGVFLDPITNDFTWSRASIAGALAIAGLVTGVFRPVAGILADKYQPKNIAILGLFLGGIALLGLSKVQFLWQFYTLFIIMGLGFTFASPATLTKLISERFKNKRSLALSLAGSGSAIGETALVPLSAFIVVLEGWRMAYTVLGLIIMFIVIPISALLLIRKTNLNNSKDSEFIQEDGKENPSIGTSFKEALRTPIFWALTLGFFT